MLLSSAFTLSLLSTIPLTLSHPDSHHAPARQITYSVVPSIFLQSDPSTDASTLNFTATNFGLIPRTYPDAPPGNPKLTQWQRLSHYISTLNRKARARGDRDRKQHYTLLFLARHGEGYHNAAESYFGTPAWNCYYSELEGNDTVTWADPRLTEKGIKQALTVKGFWQHLIQDEKIAVPQRYYTSPLWRCLQTADLTFSGIDLPRKYPFKPVVKEGFREGVSAHTCDRRSTRSAIHKQFPNYQFEHGFPEVDPLWRPLQAETREAQDARSKKVLDEVLGDVDAGVEYISITSHSGEIASLLRVLNHREFRLATGAAIPVLVNITVGPGRRESPSSTLVPPFEPVATCAKPPTTRDSSCNDCSCCK
ncbi:phosphoglycerate mutase family protein [Westerdykella ornata]|uniref:Phosphoglycerate mutase family protein n=1 Tax=Westerdykella ornata TaxID=318751 RepID=A0A6A6J5M2_WESOR|nr:phosphoglycerate mutase family protein [Westerdykella ornata]KAF2271433.1 phosphoglycerate mutase family protein [Westerdykella ornata]